MLDHTSNKNADEKKIYIGNVSNVKVSYRNHVFNDVYEIRHDRVILIMEILTSQNKLKQKKIIHTLITAQIM